jgi:fumarate reductase flavoprotein subunit
VVGVTAGGVAYRARRAVVLATGDYSANEELKRTWASPQVGRIPAINPDSTGDGFTMGMAVGAVPCNTWRTMDELRFHLPPGRRELIRRLPVGPRAARAMRIAIERLPRDVVGWFARSAMTSWVAPSAALFQSGAILVGPRGTRFGNELHHPARALTDEPENRCWLVIDAVMARRFAPGGEPVSTFPGIAYAYLRDYAKFRPDAHREATTPAELGAAVGVPGPALADTIDRYNRFVDAGVDDDVGRRELGPGLRAGPYVALGPLGAFVTLTEGGLLIDDECHVLDRDGGRIDGLLAVGSTGQGGLILRNHGLHIAWALTSGRLAGRVAARATATSVASS